MGTLAQCIHVLELMMPCYHPLKAWHVGYHDSGKDKYKITSYTTNYVKEALADAIDIPCGRCIGCRLDYSRQWADRCMLELKEHKQSWFCTFTYDPEHLPINYRVNEETGEVSNAATLCKRDFQLFMKRLRKQYEANGHDNHIMYFCAGEYGDTTFRPHYHAIIFGLDLDDLKVYKRTADGYIYYNSDFLQSVWQKGQVVITDVTWDTCAYTARYIMKKQYGSASEIYEKYNIQPEFTLMSRRPAIGRKYYDEHKNVIFDTDLIFIGTDKGSHSIKPPKYYRRLYDFDEPELSAEMKEKNKVIADDLKKLKLERTSLPYLEMLASEEENKLASISALKRKEF